MEHNTISNLTPYTHTNTDDESIKIMNTANTFLFSHSLAVSLSLSLKGENTIHLISILLMMQIHFRNKGKSLTLAYLLLVENMNAMRCRVGTVK